MKNQYERDRTKAEALKLENERKGSSDERNLGGAQRNSSVDDSTSLNTPEATRPDSRDPEKAEQAPASTDSPQQETNDGVQNGQPTEGMERINTLKPSQTAGTALGTVFTGIEVRQMTREMSHKLERKHTKTKHGKPQAAAPPRDKVFVVNYESESDPMDPHNWSLARKILATAVVSAIAFIVGFASSIDSGAVPQAAETFGVSQVTESLATGIFLIGFGVGALFAGPISETIGRNPVYIITLVSRYPVAFRDLIGLSGKTGSSP